MGNAGSVRKTLGQIVTPFVWLGGGLLLAAALVVCIWTGSPHALIHALGADPLLPPVWLLGILWLGAFFLFGCTAGAVLSDKSGGAAKAVWRLRGGMYFLIGCMAALVWYPLLFAVSALWLSWLFLLLALAMSILCLLCWSRLRWWAVAGVGVWMVWLICLVVMQFTVIIQI